MSKYKDDYNTDKSVPLIVPLNFLYTEDGRQIHLHKEFQPKQSVLSYASNYATAVHADNATVEQQYIPFPVSSSNPIQNLQDEKPMLFLHGPHDN